MSTSNGVDQNQMAEAHKGQKCPCPHHKMIPIFLVLLGLSFLLTVMGVISTTVNNYVWPILVILIGLQKIFEGRCTCCSRM